MTKFSSLLYVNFVLPFLFALILASDRAVLYGNVGVSILVLSLKNVLKFISKLKY